MIASVGIDEFDEAVGNKAVVLSIYDRDAPVVLARSATDRP
jgi:hypothetical protein